MNRRDLLTNGLVATLAVLASAETLCAQQRPPKTDEDKAEFFKESRQRFRDSRRMPKAWQVFVALGLFLAFAFGLVGLNIYYRRRSKAGIDNPKRLFKELVRVHELSGAEKQFLKDFAAESNLADPLPLFVEPKYFLSALDDDRFRASHRMIDTLLKKLYDIRDREKVVLPLEQQPYAEPSTAVLLPGKPAGR